jgi:hypothetical protein
MRYPTTKPTPKQLKTEAKSYGWHISAREIYKPTQKTLRRPKQCDEINPKTPHRPFYGFSIAEEVALAKRCIESDDKDCE